MRAPSPLSVLSASPLSVLSGALKIAQVYGYHGGCWRQDSLEFSRLGGRAGHRRAAGSIKGQLYLLPEPGTAKIENISRTAYTRPPEDFE
jgi:hypothetical protein